MGIRQNWCKPFQKGQNLPKTQGLTVPYVDRTVGNMNGRDKRRNLFVTVITEVMAYVVKCGTAI